MKLTIEIIKGQIETIEGIENIVDALYSEGIERATLDSGDTILVYGNGSYEIVEDKKGVIYKLGELHVQTIVKNGMCAYTNCTIEEYLQIKGEGYIFCSWEEALKHIEEAEKKKFNKPMIEIDLEEYEDALNCLPPLKWTKLGRKNDELFFMSEFYTGNYTALYIRKDGKHYTAIRECNLDKAVKEYNTL